MATKRQWRRKDSGDEKTVATKRQWRRKDSGDEKTVATKRQWRRKDSGDEHSKATVLFTSRMNFCPEQVWSTSAAEFALGKTNITFIALFFNIFSNIYYSFQTKRRLHNQAHAGRIVVLFHRRPNSVRVSYRDQCAHKRNS